MPTNASTDQMLRAENAELRARLEEAEETLRAIRAGEVEALVVEGAAGPQIFILQGLEAEQIRLHGEMLAQVSDAIITVDTEQRITFLNAAAERQYGVRSGDLLGRKLTEIFTQHWPIPEAEGAMWTALSERGEWRGELIHRTPDGREWQIESSVTALRGPDGAGTGYVIANRDIRERKQAEAALRARTDEMETLLDALPACVWISRDAECRVIVGNRMANEFLSVDATTNVTASVAATRETSSVRQLKEDGTEYRVDELPLQRAIATGQLVRDAVLDFHFSDGRRVHMVGHAVPLFDDHGRIRGGLAVFVDITKRRRAEEVLARLAAIVESSHDALFSEDLDGIITSWNRGAEQIFGYRAEEITGTSIMRLIPAGLQAAEHKLQRQIVAGELGGTFETIRLTKDGREFPASITIAPITDSAGKVIGTSRVLRDITERNRAVEALARNAVLFAKIIEQAPGGVYVMDSQLRVQEVNTEALPIFASVQPVIGRELGYVLETLWGPEIGQEATAIFRRTLATGERYVSPRFDHRRQDIGLEQAYEWETQRLTLPDGQHGVVCYFQDVTARERATTALRTSEAHMRLATEATGVGIWEWNVLTNQIRWDAQMFRLYGIAPTPDGLMPYQTWAGAVMPEDLAAIEAILQETVRRLGRSTRSFRIGRANDGECRHIEAVETVRTNAQGQAEWVLGTNLDVTERKMTEELQRASSAYARSLIEASLDPLVTISAQGKITDVNEASAQATGVPREQLIGTDFSDYFTAPDNARAGYQKAFSEGLVRDYPLAIRHTTGRILDVLYNAAVYRDDKGNVLGVFAAARDVTERKRFEQSLEQTNEELRTKSNENVVIERKNAEVELARLALEEKAAELARASGYKSEFLANMSHELRTPLNVILLLSQQLAEDKPGNLSAQQREFAQLVHSSGADLLNLINDILDLAKIESGTVTVQIGEVSLAGLCDSITRHFQPMADAKKLRLHASLAGDLPPSLHSDTQRVRQILKNLVANALKFTDHGHVELRVRLATRGWTPDHPGLSQATQVIAFVVKDTGIGIAPEKQRRIFESFQQADATTSRHHGGTGLGLAISRQLAALLGGAITLKSAPGQGSTFTLYLPQIFVGRDRSGETGETGGRKIIVEVARRSRPLTDGPDLERQRPTRQFPAESPGEQARPDVSRGILCGRKVLVVDDDVRNIFALTALLENHEMEIISATNGRGAIHLLQTTPGVSLVLMDIMMPEMDGYETMRELRQSPQFRTLPVVALTAHAMTGDREKCLEAGASDYLAKPVNSEQLLAVMSEWMAR